MARSEQSYRAARKAAAKAEKLSWRDAPAYWAPPVKPNLFKKRTKPSMLLKVPTARQNALQTLSGGQ